MKIDKNNIKNIIMLLCICTVMGVLYFFTNNVNIFTITNIIIAAIIIYKAKFSYFSLKIILINYILFPVFFQYNYNESYGVLSIGKIQLHYVEINICILIYNVLCYLWIFNTDILEKEKNILKNDYEISNKFAIVASIIAIAASIIALPYAPFQKFSDVSRFNTLIVGNAWNHLAIVALIFAFPKLKKNRIVQLSYIFVIFWFLSHYERVDIIGLIALLAIISIVKLKKKITWKAIVKYGVILFIVLALLVFIGEVRTGNNNVNVFRKLLLQNTASDLGYVFNCSIEYNMNKDKLYGKTYLTYFIEAIPLLNSNDKIETILQNEYNTPGGAYLLSEPIMNFGILGIVLFQILEFVTIQFIINKNKYSITYYIYLFLIATAFRTTWYGINYIEMGLLYFIPVMYIISKLDKKS